MKPSRRLGGVRFSTPLLVLLAVVTCGLYTPFWYIQRRHFFDQISRREKLGSLPFVLLALFVLNIVVAAWVGFTVVRGESGSENSLSNIVSLAAGIMSLVLAFRCRSILEQYLSRIGKPRRFSGVATFFFQMFYLQYKMNLAADELAAVASKAETDASVFD